jgi:hypothetical protein
MITALAAGLHQRGPPEPAPAVFLRRDGEW